MNYLRLLNFFLVLAIGAVTLFIFWSPLASDEGLSPLPLPSEESLLKNPFLQTEGSYREIEKGWMENEVAFSILLPDLREELLFLGKNQRPDLAKEMAVYLAFKKNPEPQQVALHTPIYLKYSGSKSKPREKGSYSFSPSNAKTPFWLELHAEEDRVVVTLFIENETGCPVVIPEEHHSFTLFLQEENKRNFSWEIGGHRVDSTLLFRHGARLVGKDFFFELHGGKEFEFTASRERIDFISSEKLYSCFVKEKDFLLYKEGLWIVPKEGESSENYPLLFIKNINEKGMQLELWDESGRHKMALALIRSKPMEALPDITQEFKIVGAKTWVECIVECRSKRVILREGDWVLLTKEGWRKIASEQEVDDYVGQKLMGPLFVLDKIAKKNGRTQLLGHLFNSSRTACENVELLAQENPVLELEP